MAIEKTVTINVDGKRAVKSLEELGGTFEDVYGEIQPLNTQIGELEDRLYEMSLRGEQGTKEFKDLTSQVGKMRKTIIDTDLAIDGMSQNMAQASTGAVMGIASGFELAQGSMAAFGVEGEQVEATLLKVQSAMAISQGLQGIREAIPSFKNLAAQVSMFGGNIMKSVKALGAFQKAMIATGIGALIAGIGLLVANWDKLTEAISGTSEKQKAYNDTLEDYKTGTQDAIKQTNKVETAFNLARDGVISKEEALKTYNETLGASFGQAKNLNEAEELFVKKTDAYIQAAGLRAQADALFAKAAEESANAVTAGSEDQTSTLDVLEATLLSFVGGAQSANKSLIESQKEGVKAARETSNQRANAFTEMAEKMLKEATNIEKANEIVSTSTDKVTNSVKKETKAVEESIEAKRKRWAEEDAEMQQRMQQQREYAAQLELEAQKAADAEIEAEIQREQQASDRLFARLEQETAMKKAARDKEIELEQQAEEAKYSIANDALSATANLFNAFAGENEKAQERAFKITKAINIAQAVMDTYKGATAIFASTAANPVSIANPAAPFIAAGSAIAAGIANVASIARQTFQGGSSGGASGGGGATAPSLGGGAGSNPATFNVVGNTGNNQLAQTLGSGTMKAYVVSGDVSSAQELERNKIQQSTL